MFILLCYIFLPGFLAEVDKIIFEVFRQPDVIKLSHILLYVLSAYDSCYLEQLVIVILSLEKRFFGEHHACKHAARGPNIERVVIVIVCEKKFGRLEVA